jgi:putative flippase GtrA
MVGNLVLMRLLVQQARMPVMPSNAMAIVCCSIVNFCLGDGWAFAEKPAETDARAKQMRARAG